MPNAAETSVRAHPFAWGALAFGAAAHLFAYLTGMNVDISISYTNPISALFGAAGGFTLDASIIYLGSRHAWRAHKAKRG